MINSKYKLPMVLLIINNSSTFYLRSSSCKTDLSIHFQPSQPTAIWMFFWVTLVLSSSTFHSETDHSKREITLGGWQCGLRFFKLGHPLHTGFKPTSLAWLACSTGQSATTCRRWDVTRACSKLLASSHYGNCTCGCQYDWKSCFFNYWFPTELYHMETSETSDRKHYFF